MYEIFDPRYPNTIIKTTHTEIGARLSIWWLRRHAVIGDWFDYAREGEGWL